MKVLQMFISIALLCFGVAGVSLLVAEVIYPSWSQASFFRLENLPNALLALAAPGGWLLFRKSVSTIGREDTEER